MKKGYWRCKQHKEECKSYVQGIVEDLNNGKSEEGFMHLVEFVKPDGKVRKVKCLNCGKDMYETWDNIAKEYTGYIWKCTCTPPNLILSVG